MTPDDARREEARKAAREVWDELVQETPRLTLDAVTPPCWPDIVDAETEIIDAVTEALLAAREAGRKEGAEEEREACAKVADHVALEHHRNVPHLYGEDAKAEYERGRTIETVAAAIRRRSRTPEPPKETK